MSFSEFIIDKINSTNEEIKHIIINSLKDEIFLEINKELEKIRIHVLNQQQINSNNEELKKILNQQQQINSNNEELKKLRIQVLNQQEILNQQEVVMNSLKCYRRSPYVGF
jgi:hypothetical protein